MATVLENYYDLKTQMEEFIKTAVPSQEQLIKFHELLYRINVLETCTVLCKAAPQTTNQLELSKHYCIADAFLSCIFQERRLGPPADESVKNQRNAARTNLEAVISSFRHCFKNFRTTAPTGYQKEFKARLNTVLPIWLGYRDTYIKI